MKNRPSNIRLGLLASALAGMGVTQKNGAALNVGNLPTGPYMGAFPWLQFPASADWGMSAACRRMVRKNKLRRLGIGGDKR